MNEINNSKTLSIVDSREKINTFTKYAKEIIKLVEDHRQLFLPENCTK